jgi:hypothetical protein
MFWMPQEVLAHGMCSPVAAEEQQLPVVSPPGFAKPRPVPCFPPGKIKNGSEFSEFSEFNEARGR